MRRRETPQERGYARGLRAAKLAGINAARAGGSLIDNPYSRAPHRASWEEGFIEAGLARRTLTKSPGWDD